MTRGLGSLLRHVSWGRQYGAWFRSVVEPGPMAAAALVCALCTSYSPPQRRQDACMLRKRAPGKCHTFHATGLTLGERAMNCLCHSASCALQEVTAL